MKRGTDRRRTLPKLVAVAVFAAAVVPIAAATSSASIRCPSVAPKPLKFAAPTYIDQTRPGGEPVSIVAQDGSIIVSAHGGTTHLYKDPTAYPGLAEYLASYTNQVLNWRSADGGKTWEFVGIAGPARRPPHLRLDRVLRPGPDDGRERPDLQHGDRPGQRLGVLEP